MDFQLSEDQRAFADMAQSLFADYCTDDKLREHDASGQPFMQDLWQQCVAAGLHSILVPEAAGGLGATGLLVVNTTSLRGGSMDDQVKVINQFIAKLMENDTFTDVNYTGYARIPIACASGWTDGGSVFTNAALAQFGLCTVGTNTITHVGVMTASSGGQMLRSGALGSPLSVSPGIQPQFGPGEIAITED